MSYEAWRISYQDSEQAARALWKENRALLDRAEKAEQKLRYVEINYPQIFCDATHDREQAKQGEK